VATIEGEARYAPEMRSQAPATWTSTSETRRGRPESTQKLCLSARGSVTHWRRPDLAPKALRSPEVDIDPATRHMKTLI